MTNISRFQALLLCATFSASIPSYAQAQLQAIHSNGQISAGFSKFTPSPGNATHIDYDMWDTLLETMIVYTGPSTRMRASAPKASTGTRFIYGHTSPYRLEGNRIPFSMFKAPFLEAVTEYRQDLERVGNDLIISNLSKKEQLAYWLNLHNVTIIEQLALNYPLRSPSKLKIGASKAKLHDAKLLTIQGEQLSLRDIREKIVYPNWDNPLVVYGFFLGDIGSPSIQNYAYTADNVDTILHRSAEEFVNSLRGFQVRNNKANVSKLYWDIQPFYFKNFQTDLASHLTTYMRDDVKNQLRDTNGFSKNKYETIIADLTAGNGNHTSIAPLRVDGFELTSSSVAKFIDELQQKREILIKQGRITTGTVTIQDVPTPDENMPE